MRTVLISLTAAFFFYTECSSQSITPFVIHSTGGSYGNANLNFYLDWNVGEMSLTNTMQHGSGNNLFVITNGLLQPEKAPAIELKTDVVKAELLSINDVKVFPNPTSDHIRVELKIDGDDDVEFILYNTIGQQVYSKKFSAKPGSRAEEISMHNLGQGSYLLFVKIISPHKARQGIFKIVKTN